MGMFPGFYVERDVAYNVAYWNLHSRHLSYEKGIWFCNERPLKFFHFSGYKPEHPGTVSKYTTRYMLQERKDIEPLFADYRKRLIQNQYMETQQWPYTFDRLPNGMQVTAEMRVRYREFLQAGHSELDPLSPEMFQVWQGDEAAQRKADGWTGLKGVARMLLPPVLWQSLGRGKKRLFHSAS
jgi:hypothetical protein